MLEKVEVLSKAICRDIEAGPRRTNANRRL